MKHTSSNWFKERSRQRQNLTTTWHATPPTLASKPVPLPVKAQPDLSPAAQQALAVIRTLHVRYANGGGYYWADGWMQRVEYIDRAPISELVKAGQIRRRKGMWEVNPNARSTTAKATVAAASALPRKALKVLRQMVAGRYLAKVGSGYRIEMTNCQGCKCGGKVKAGIIEVLKLAKCIIYNAITNVWLLTDTGRKLCAA